MKREIYFLGEGSMTNHALTVEVSDECPLCHTSIAPQLISAVSTENPITRQTAFTAAFLCPKCNHIFHMDFDELSKSTIYPKAPKLDLPEEIHLEYPEFSKIYAQALSAEAYGLDEIAGIGLRKALEYFVKRYAEKYTLADKETLKKESLSQTIDRIPNQQIQSLAKMLSWLGNDQTHITQKHPQYGIDDMKRFIQGLIYFIMMNRLVSEADAVTRRKQTSSPVRRSTGPQASNTEP